MSTEDPGPHRASGPRELRRLPAAVLMALQSAVLLLLGVLLIVRTIGGSESDAGRALTLAVVVLVFALGAGLIARALLRAQEGARSPTLVWGVFVVLIGATLARNGAPVLGVVVVVAGVLTLVAGWRATGVPTG